LFLHEPSVALLVATRLGLALLCDCCEGLLTPRALPLRCITCSAGSNFLIKQSPHRRHLPAALARLLPDVSPSTCWIPDLVWRSFATGARGCPRHGPSHSSEPEYRNLRRELVDKIQELKDDAHTAHVLQEPTRLCPGSGG